jgi:hypothetical protein
VKTFRNYSRARKAAGDGPILRISANWEMPLYVVFSADNPMIGVSEIGVIDPNGTVTGFISLTQLDWLGNANLAQRGKSALRRKQFFPANIKAQAEADAAAARKASVS